MRAVDRARGGLVTTPLQESAAEQSSSTTERATELKRRARALRAELPESAAEADAQNADSGHGMRRIWEEGLFSFHLPARFGGVSDASCLNNAEDYFSILLDLCAGDSGAGMNYCVQTLVTLEIFSGDNGLPESTKAELARRVTDEGLRFVASNSEAGSPRPVKARRVDGGIVVTGTKTFNTNSGGGGIANVGIFEMDGEKSRWHALIPLDSDGVTCRHDWDMMGQRGTHSQTIDYDEIFVPDGWFYKAHGLPEGAAPYVFLLHAAIMLGPGYGAFDAALEYVRKLDRPTLPEFPSASEDPLVRRRVGNFASHLEAARAYLLHCARNIELWNEIDQTEVSVEAFSVKVACVRAGLEVTQGIFDLTGARGTSGKYRFDRFWRNARTFSTHDSTDAKEVWVGDWYLSGKEPPFVAMLRV
jgi:alkylation response protein AidB-like acyl-CoA dehydrogenase